jgi:mono/diheme cytochrome c family protein
MLRETKARLLAGFTTVLVVALAALFSVLNNPAGSSAHAQASKPAQKADPRVAAGRAAYERLGCGSCHAIGGKGNADSPLDAVGARHDAATLRDWVIGGERAKLPPSLAKRKARYAADPDIDAVVAYLQTLK